MKYSGKIGKVEKLIISDPSYDENVTCRYENSNINAKNWKVGISINEVEDKITEELISTGKEFFILLYNSEEVKSFEKDGTFYYGTKNNIREIDIGIDTACIAIGINQHADLIKDSIDDWQPECSLRTLTDGIFGTVKEGKANGNINFVWIAGYLDDDAGYSEEDMVNYLIEQLEIKELQKEQNEEMEDFMEI